jgi:hypothetical protein
VTEVAADGLEDLLLAPEQRFAGVMKMPATPYDATTERALA